MLDLFPVPSFNKIEKRLIFEASPGGFIKSIGGFL